MNLNFWKEEWWNGRKGFYFHERGDLERKGKVVYNPCLLLLFVRANNLEFGIILLNDFFSKIYLFIWDRETEHGRGERQREGERGTPCWAGSLVIPGPGDHNLSQRQMLNHLSYAGAPCWMILNVGVLCQVMACFSPIGTITHKENVQFWVG